MCLTAITHTEAELLPSMIAYKMVERREEYGKPPALLPFRGSQSCSPVLTTEIRYRPPFFLLVPGDSPFFIPLGGGWAVADNQEEIFPGREREQQLPKYLPGIHAFVSESDARGYLADQIRYRNLFQHPYTVVAERLRAHFVIVEVLLRGPICGGTQAISSQSVSTLPALFMLPKNRQVPVVVYREMTLLRELP